ETDNQPPKNRAQYAFNLTLAAVAGQVGCLTLVIIFVSLFGGLWLDNTFDTRPIFTILLLVGSVPVTIIAMFWVVRKATSHIKSAEKQNSENIQENAESGR
ncbi:MAG: AtpZ/AtpI family protein, partial [Gammaproteobacteria bacterium]|nr:AtpZ/AtpI family protein [Gammaproteobacteria bacterium]